MYARRLSAIAVFVLLTAHGSLNAQDAGPSDALTRTTRRPLFSAEELDRAEAIAAERQESYIRVSDDDDVIVLAPYIVEGDNSLVMARLRRDLEQGAGARRHLRIAMDPIILQDLHLRQKSDHQFFHGPTAGTPADRPDTIDWLGIAVGIFNAVREKRAGDLFRAPGPGGAPRPTLSLGPAR